MFKRFTCMILSFVLLLALVPAGAIEVSAAGNATSDKAITILKKLEIFVDHCDVNGYTGYGTKCTEKGTHGHYYYDEDVMDHVHPTGFENIFEVVEAENGKCYIVKPKFTYDATIKATDTLANYNRTDGYWYQLDSYKPFKNLDEVTVALRWISIPASYRTAIENYDTNNPGANLKKFIQSNWTKLKGMACPVADTKTGTNSVGPFYYHTIRETEADAALREALKKIDTAINNFASSNGLSLAQHQHDALALFSYENGTQWMNGSDDLRTAVIKGYTGWDFAHVLTDWKSGDSYDRRMVEANMYVNGKYNSDGSKVEFYVPSSDDDEVDGDWTTVTVTNGYVNIRAKASIYGTHIGTAYAGDVLYIQDTVQNGIWLWGQIVDKDGDEQGYVALMYTDYDDVIASSGSSSSSSDSNKKMGTATVTAKGYVNVRNGAGTHNAIISSYREGAKVDLYGIQYVNGIPWGKTPVGWFSLSYANYTIEDYDRVEQNSYGYVNYNFSGKLNDNANIVTTANGSNPTDHSLAVNDSVNISRVVSKGGETWGQIVGSKKVTKGDAWIKMSQVNMTPATFTTITEVNVREGHSAGSKLRQTLKKGTEFDITQVYADETTVWGYAEAARNADLKYDGWLNLSNLNVTRKGATLSSSSSSSGDSTVVTLGEVVNCVELNIRNKASIFGTAVGKLAVGTIVEIADGPVNGNAKTGWYLLDINPGDGVESWARGDYLKIYEGPRSSVNYGIKSEDIKSPDGQSAATGRGMVANTYGGLNVRTAPGTANGVITKLMTGTEVTVLEVQYHGSAKWGKISLADGKTGWASMDYIAMMDYDELPESTTATASTQAVYTGSVNDTVKVYKDAISKTKLSQTTHVRDLDAGDAITVYELLTVKEVTYDDGETTQTETMYWARINDGYIWLNDEGHKIELDPLNEAEYTVTGADMLKVREYGDQEAPREDMDLKKGDVVKVTEVEINKDQIWGKIEHEDLTDGEAWICLNYCTKGNHASSGSTDSGSNSGSGSGSNGGATVPGETQSIGNTGVCNYAGTIIGQYPEVTVRKEPTTNSKDVTKLKKGTAVTITETRLVDGTSWGYCGSGWIALLYVDLAPVGITAIDAKVIGNEGAVVYESSQQGALVVGSYVRRAVVNIYEEVNNMYKTDMGWISKANVLN